MKATVKVGPKEQDVDLKSVTKAVFSVVAQVNAVLGSVRDAINNNESSFAVIREATGVAADYLPDAEQYHGGAFIFSQAGAADELWLSVKDALDAYAWTQITIP